MGPASPSHLVATDGVADHVHPRHPTCGWYARLSVTLHVNGVARKLTIAPWTTLLDALRLRLDLTGTKKGCDHGQCGAFLNGRHSVVQSFPIASTC
jgi:hypothetical protein